MTHPPDHSEWHGEGEATREIEFIILQWGIDRELASSRDDRTGRKKPKAPPKAPPTVRDLAERIVAKLTERGSVLR